MILIKIYLILFMLSGSFGLISVGIGDKNIRLSNILWKIGSYTLILSIISFIILIMSI